MQEVAGVASTNWYILSGQYSSIPVYCRASYDNLYFTQKNLQYSMNNVNKLKCILNFYVYINFGTNHPDSTILIPVS